MELKKMESRTLKTLICKHSSQGQDPDNVALLQIKYLEARLILLRVLELNSQSSRELVSLVTCHHLRELHSLKLDSHRK